MAANAQDLLMEDLVLCPTCGDQVPRGHTVLRVDLGRVCWFCHTDENVDPDTDPDDDWDDDDEDWDDWDD